ncbi:MSMEG_0570 family nitrogen starvation response protein [Sphingomonas echinoides]|uniref:MSMEG_0570 family nitrogen starvation response protein n=2 Tax=Sphingomonas TaxID=13687 RepID=UPI00241306BA|nr:MSMEG_0570 family nitrogen starvation response protein [Sphingomonas echinoides]
MPEMRFVVRWPDGHRERCYSPSTIIAERLTAGIDYPLADFVRDATAALEEASDRVRARYGMGCGHAMQQSQQITNTARRFADRADAVVHIERFES